MDFCASTATRAITVGSSPSRASAEGSALRAAVGEWRTPPPISSIACWRMCRSASGAHAALPAAISMCLGCTAHNRSASRLLAFPICRAATTGETPIRGPAGTQWLGHLHPAFRVGPQPNTTLSCSRTRRGVSRPDPRSRILRPAPASGDGRRGASSGRYRASDSAHRRAPRA